MVPKLRIPIPQSDLLLLIQPNNPIIPLPSLPLPILPLIISNTNTRQRTRNDLSTDIDIMPTIEIRLIFLKIRPSSDNSTSATESNDETTTDGTNGGASCVIETPC